MPHWNCERCGARLYSASKSLKRQACPVCQGRLMAQGDQTLGSPPRTDAESLRGAQSPLTASDL